MESTVKGETRRGGDDKERDYDDQASGILIQDDVGDL